MTAITKKLLITILMATTLTVAYAQNVDNNQSCTYDQCKQQFKSEKVAYITSGMGLTVEEAQKFWPLYNKYDAIFDSIGEARRVNYSRKECMKNYDKMTDAKAGDIIAKSFEYDTQELETRRRYTRNSQKSSHRRKYCSTTTWNTNSAARNSPTTSPSAIVLAKVSRINKHVSPPTTTPHIVRSRAQCTGLLKYRFPNGSPRIVCKTIFL